jgi:NADPH-dependent curcumin reductase CurA
MAELHAARANRRWVLAKTPDGRLQETDFELRTDPLPVPSAGEALGRARWLTFEAAMRAWLAPPASRDGTNGSPPARGYPLRVRPGDVMAGPAVVEIVASRRADLAEGDLVRNAMFGWQEYVRIGADLRVQHLDPAIPMDLQLAALVGNGPTAYFGVLEVGGVRAGDTVVVSGAAGATGSMAAQIARIAGARVIGIAGSSAKCRWLVEGCHLDAAIDYRHESVSKRLRELCPDSIDVFFDAVGGPVLEAAIDNMADHGRIVLCGQTASYDASDAVLGPRNLFELVTRRVRMEGYLLSDFADRLAEAQRAIATWLAADELVARAEVHDGFENAPRAFLGLFSGTGTGKQLLRL